MYTRKQAWTILNELVAVMPDFFHYRIDGICSCLNSMLRDGLISHRVWTMMKHRTMVEVCKRKKDAIYLYKPYMWTRGGPRHRYIKKFLKECA